MLFFSKSAKLSNNEPYNFPHTTAKLVSHVYKGI